MGGGTGRLWVVIDGELGRFLRDRRESVTPAEVGLPTGTRRRTPGLRRAELATLAGISVDYLVRLEQGRDTHPSAQVLAAIADALHLGEDDLTHLRTLAAISNGRELCPSGRPLARQVRSNVTAMLDALEPSAAFVLNRLSDVLAWNAAFERIVGPVGVLDGDDPNLTRFTFADPRSASVFPDWSLVADDQVSSLRAGAACADPALDRLVAELSDVGGAAFADRWATSASAVKRSGQLRINHPDVGTLRLVSEMLQLPDGDEQHLVVWLPGDEGTAAALDQLNGRFPGALHAVAQVAG
jgi:transcriptional regulator with XRE-family HTH domain